MSWQLLALEAGQLGIIGFLIVLILIGRQHDRRLRAMEQHHDYVLHLRNCRRVTHDPLVTIRKHER